MKKLTLLTLLPVILLCMITNAWSVTVSIGSGTTTIANVPLQSQYDYNYSQQIYSSTLIGTSGDITTLRFYYSSGSILNANSLVIYMGDTTKSSFSSFTDWVPVAQLTQVFSGTIPLPVAAGWIDITLQTAFTHLNDKNLVVAVDENSVGWAPRSCQWGSFDNNGGVMPAVFTGLALGAYSDVSPAAPGTGNYKHYLINRIQLEITPLVIIDNPTPFTASPVNYGQIDLDWTRNSSLNDVMVAVNTVNSFGTPVAGTTYNVGSTVGGTGLVIFNGSGSAFQHTALVQATTYYYKAWSLTAAKAYSSGVTANATTPIRNYNVNVSSGSIDGATIFANGTTTGFTAPHTFALPQGTNVTYSVEKPDYAWALATGSESNVITNLVGDKNIAFEGTYTHVESGFTYTGDPNVPITGVPGTVETLTVPLPTLTPVGAVVMVFTGSIVSNLTVTVPIGTWYVIAYYNDPADGGLAWHHGNPYPAIGISSVVFVNVPFGAKADIPVIIDHVDDTLPVELSSFTAIATADYFVNLQWTTQSETNLSGYYIYRNAESSLGSATCINAMIPAVNSSRVTEYRYTDSEAIAGNTYYYWLQALDLDGTMSYHGPISIALTDPGDGNEQPVIPITTCLLPNYPNPFNPRTSLVYQIKSPETVTLSIYNTRGQLVRSYQQTHSTAGTFSVIFDGTDAQGKALSSGVYYCLMQAGKTTSHSKMVLLK